MATGVVLSADVAIVLLTAAVVAFLASWTDQPTIVGYVLAGLLIGDAGLQLLTPSPMTETMSELGLAFLLFLLGLKMHVEDVRDVLRPVVAISIPQMALVFLAGAGIALLLGFTSLQALVIGLAVMYSSTAVVVKMLSDADEITAPHGKVDVGVLLVQDVVVVLVLATLGAGRPESALDLGVTLLTVLALTAALALVGVAASRYVLPGVLRRIADNKDVFFLIAIGWAFLFVYVSDQLDLSIEMGAFVAGLALAQLPYSTELQDRVTPLTDLFVMIFFVTIGLQLEASDLAAHWEAAVVAALVLLPVKFVVFFALVHWQEFDLETTFLASVGMTQVSEFAIVLGAAAVAADLIDSALLGFLSLVALLTMSVSVYAARYNHRLFELCRPYLQRWERHEGRAVRDHQYRDHAVVIGYDEITEGVLPLLDAYYEDVVVIDRKVAHVEAMSEAGYEVVFGDFRHGEVRKEAGLKHADFVLSSTAEVDVNEALLEEVGRDATVFVEAEWPDDARELYDRGAHYVVLSTQLTAERLAEYLELYFEDRAAFDDRVSADLDVLREAARNPEGGGLPSVPSPGEPGGETGG